MSGVRTWGAGVSSQFLAGALSVRRRRARSRTDHMAEVGSNLMHGQGCNMRSRIKHFTIASHHGIIYYRSRTKPSVHVPLIARRSNVEACAESFGFGVQPKAYPNYCSPAVLCYLPLCDPTSIYVVQKRHKHSFLGFWNLSSMESCRRELANGVGVEGA
jgi:hypothetical protein